MKSLVFIAAVLFSGAAACRQQKPDELVYTGKKAAPPGPAFDASISPVDAGTGEVAFTKADLLVAIADCTVDVYRRFQVSTVQLIASATTAAADPTDSRIAELQDSWREAMARWQDAEMFRFGPAARTVDPGGVGLRDQIYSWPLVSRCTIEEQIVSQIYAAPDFANTRINARGLGAMEYLIFYTGTDNVCSRFSRINAEGSWAALSPEDLRRRKLEYAAAIAKNVESHVVELLAVWDERFKNELLTAGAGSGVFATDHDALNAISDALFYLDKELKDLKLGRPLGLSECANEICPESFESIYARSSREHVRANLRGFQKLFLGCGEGGAGIGFDDWLSAAGAGELSSRMTSALLGAIAVADAIDRPLEELIFTDIDRLWALYNATKALNDPLKSELITVLNLELPKTVEGDND